MFDWIGYPLLVLQMYIFAYKPRKLGKTFNLDKLGFFIGVIACIFMVFWSIQIISIPAFVVNSVLCFINLKGFIGNVKS